VGGKYAMAREINRLTALQVSKAKRPGMYPDGGGLYLRVGPTGAKSWVYRYMLNGRRHDMGLGPLNAISLADARTKAGSYRKSKVEGDDPLSARAAKTLALKLEAAKAVTFKECAKAYIEAHAAGWKNKKHSEQWTSTLTAYAYPIIGDLSVQTIDTGLVMKVLEPIWQTKTETASRIRGRIESILDWAAVREHRRGDNPARWRGHLDKLLPKRTNVQKVKHHAAIPYDQITSFMKVLRRQDSVGARGLEFQILTASRSGEVMGARWEEIDFKKKLWTVPGERMKAKREHRVPLSDDAVAILQGMEKIRTSEFVFPGLKKNKPLSNMAFLMVLERMKRSDLTSHGFRSTFRDWAAERTNYPREAAEMALAHTVSDKVEAAYRRGDLFEKRRNLMADWALFCGGSSKE
jgi:integrase